MAFSVFDDKAYYFSAPYFLPTTATAIRAFTDAVNDPTHHFHAHPSDYALYHIGNYDDKDGTMEPLEHKINLGTAFDYINKTFDPQGISKNEKS